MKALRRLIILVIVVVIGVPAAVGGAALIKDAKPPTYLSDVDLNTFKVDEEFYQSEIDKFVIQFLAGDQSISMDQKEINKIIYASMNGFKDDKSQIEIGDGQTAYIDGIWTEFNKGQLTMYTLVRYRGISTTLTVAVGVKSTDDAMELTLDKVKVGQLPIPKSIFTAILKNADLENEYTEVDADQLMISISKEYIQDQLEENMDNNIILFDSIELKDGAFVVNCDLNPENQDAVAIQNTINEFKAIVQNDTLVTNITNTLDTSDPDQSAFKDDLDDFTQILKDKINNPTGIDDTDIDTFDSLQANFQKLTPEKQQDVIDAFEQSVDPDVMDEINTALQNMDIEGFDSMSDLMLGGGTIPVDQP